MATSTPRLSVILAVYNQERFLPALLSSLEAQDCPVPYEVIVCDDGSTDATADRLRACRALDIRHIWQPNRGFRVARSRNNGIRCAQGEVLVFLDGDSIVRPFFLRDHWDAHSEPGRLVCGSYQNVGLRSRGLPADAAEYLARLPDPNAGSDRSERRPWLDTDRPWMACTSGNMSVERSRVVLFDEDFNGWGSEDRDFAYRAYRSGVRVFLLERVGLVHLWQQTESVPWNPGKGGDAASVIAALTSKLRLYRKYPGEVMAPSLDLVRYCRYDERADTWRIGVVRKDVTVDAIFAEFEAWLARRNASSSAVT